MLTTVRREAAVIGISLALAATFTGCWQVEVDHGATHGKPTGVELAYTVSLGIDSEIRTTNMAGSTSAIQVDGDVRSMKWSADGRILSWVTYDYQTRQSSLWTMETNHIITQLVTGTTNSLGYRWAPDSERMVVMEFDPDDGRNLDVYGLYVDTQVRAPVWFESLAFQTFIDVAISPDWQYVAYFQSGTSNLVVCDSDANTWEIFELPPGVHGFTSLVWSPDSQWLAFSATGTDYAQVDVFISRPDGRGLQQLTSGPGIREALGWSPSSESLAFASMDSIDANQLCYVDTRATQMSPHCIKATYAGGGLEWISDTEWVFVTNRLNGQWDIYRASVVDATLTNLTQDDQVESGLAVKIIDSASDHTPSDS